MYTFKAETGESLEFEASVVHRENSRMTRDTQRNPVSKSQKEKQNKITTTITVTHSNLQRNPHIPPAMDKETLVGVVLIPVRSRADGRLLFILA